MSQTAPIAYRCLSQVSDKNLSQVFVPSQTTLWLPCLCPLPNIWKVQHMCVDTHKWRTKYAVFLDEK